LPLGRDADVAVNGHAMSALRNASMAGSMSTLHVTL